MGIVSCSEDDQDDQDQPNVADARLAWSPPVLSQPETLQVTSEKARFQLDDDTDYVLELPDEPLEVADGLNVSGGRNVVIIGGEIRIPGGLSQKAGDWTERRAMYLKDQTGTVHVEGVRMSGDLAEGIDLSQSKKAVVQLQNIVVERVDGSYDTNHADLLQVWAGPRQLRVDGFSGETGYQGFFLLPNQHYDGPSPEVFDIRRVRIRGIENSAYLLWAPTDGADWLKLTDVEVVADDGRGRKALLRPLDTWHGADVLADRVTLSSSRLPGGVPGAGYVSPGYQDGSTAGPRGSSAGSTPRASSGR